MKTILLTGATGFVGTHTLKWLAQQPNIKLIAACRKPEALWSGFDGEVRVGDMMDANYRASLVKGVDVICHAAAWTSLWKNKKNAEALHQAPTLALANAAKQAGVKHWVNVSTTSVVAPTDSTDAMRPGVTRNYWPHMSAVINIENALRELADDAFSVANCRLGLFIGEHYRLGLLPILLPRLKTHLVPWVQGGKTQMPLIDGADIGQAIGRAAMADLNGYQGFNFVGTEIPTVREVINHLHDEYGYPRPHFSVPFSIAFPFAWLMEKIDLIVPWEPLVTRSIIHLLRNTGANNQKAAKELDYQPKVHWKDALRKQMQEMEGKPKMKMARPI